MITGACPLLVQMGIGYQSPTYATYVASAIRPQRFSWATGISYGKSSPLPQVAVPLMMACQRTQRELTNAGRSALITSSCLRVFAKTC